MNGVESLEDVEEIDRPFLAPITSAKYLTAPTSEKKVSRLSTQPKAMTIISLTEFLI